MTLEQIHFLRAQVRFGPTGHRRVWLPSPRANLLPLSSR